MDKSYSKKEKVKAGIRALARGAHNAWSHLYELGQLVMVVFIHPLYVGTMVLWGMFAFIDPLVGGQRIVTLALTPSVIILGIDMLRGLKSGMVEAYKDELQDTLPEQDMREKDEWE